MGMGNKRSKKIGHNCLQHTRRNLGHGEGIFPRWEISAGILTCPSGPRPCQPGVSSYAPSLGADGEVSAFLRLTIAKPIRLLIVLHEGGQANIAPQYFSLDRFDPPVRYDELDEDSDAVVRNAACVRNAAGVHQRQLPHADHMFELRIYELRYREKQK